VPFISRRPSLKLTRDEKIGLQQLSQSRSEPAGRVQRAEILLRYHRGETVSGIAAALCTNRPRVERCLAKALELGVRGALQDLPGRGRRRALSAEARAWVVALACQKPKDLGYAQELWTTRLLAKHARKHAVAAGHPSLHHLARGTVSKILRAQPLQAHQIEYYRERRDAELEAKMKQVLHVYRQVELGHQAGTPAVLRAVLAYDDKPGIQALEDTARDLAPVPGQHATLGRDHEFVRHGTLSLLAGLDLGSGEVLGLVRERHSSAEFIEFLRLADAHYPAGARIRVVLDNHSAHLSRETRAFLATVPNRFEFIFTPTHGSWVNLIESFFGKMVRILLRGLPVKSKEELKCASRCTCARLMTNPWSSLADKAGSISPAMRL